MAKTKDMDSLTIKNLAIRYACRLVVQHPGISQAGCFEMVAKFCKSDTQYLSLLDNLRIDKTNCLISRIKAQLPDSKRMVYCFFPVTETYKYSTEFDSFVNDKNLDEIHKIEKYVDFANVGDLVMWRGSSNPYEKVHKDDYIAALLLGYNVYTDQKWVEYESLLTHFNNSDKGKYHSYHSSTQIRLLDSTVRYVAPSAMNFIPFKTKKK